MSREKTQLFCPGTSDLNGTGKGLNINLDAQYHRIIDMKLALRERKVTSPIFNHTINTE